MKELFADGSYDAPLEDSFNRDNFFGLISTIFDGLIFLVDPLDIAQQLWQVNVIVKDWLSKSRSGNGVFSFDEYFSAFLVLFLVKPPINSIGIATLLRMSSATAGDSAISQAALMFIGATEYVEHFGQKRDKD
jgi:hypothetical protein